MSRSLRSTGMSVAPPADAGVIMKEMGVLGWKGVQVVPVGTNAMQLVQIGGAAAEGAYMGYAGDYDGQHATPKQRELNKGILAAVGETMSPLQISSYDALYALAAAMKSANSVEPKVIAETLPKIMFDTSYGKTAFGGAATYGTPQQLLVPVMITQIRNGKMVEINRLIPDELTKRIAAAK